MRSYNIANLFVAAVTLVALVGRGSDGTVMEVEDILFHDGIEYVCEDFYFTRPLTHQEIQELDIREETKVGYSDDTDFSQKDAVDIQIQHHQTNEDQAEDDFQANIGGGGSGTITLSFPIFHSGISGTLGIHGKADYGWARRNRNRDEISNTGKTESVAASSIESRSVQSEVFSIKGGGKGTKILGNWTLHFKLRLRGLSPNDDYDCDPSTEETAARITGKGIDLTVPYQGPRFSVVFDVETPLDFEFPLNDQATFEKFLAVRNRTDTLKVQLLSTQFPLRSQKTGKKVLQEMEKMIVRSHPACVFLSFSDAEMFSPWYIKHQVRTQNGKKPITLRMALDAINREIATEESLPDQTFLMTDNHGLESIKTDNNNELKFGAINSVNDPDGDTSHVILLFRRNKDFYEVLANDVLDEPLRKDSVFEFLARDIDAMATLPCKNIAQWSESERHALLVVLESNIMHLTLQEDTKLRQVIDIVLAKLRLFSKDVGVKNRGLQELSTIGTNGDYTVCNDLYWIYSDGRFIEENEEQKKAHKNYWRTQCLAHGNKSMSMQYEEGVSCFENGDYDKAVKWFREAAENGHPGAQYYLGRCYEEGLGVGRNTTTGNDWYKRAAEGGEERAIKALTHRTSKSTGKLSVKIPSEVSKSTNNTESVVPPWTRETDSNRKQIADEKPSFTPNIDLPSIMSPRHEEPYVIGPLPQGTSREALEAFRCVNHYIQYGSDLGAGYVQSEFMTLVDELIKMNNPSGAARYAKIYLEHFPSGTYANVMRYEILFYFR